MTSISSELYEDIDRILIEAADKQINLSSKEGRYFLIDQIVKVYLDAFQELIVLAKEEAHDSEN